MFTLQRTLRLIRTQALSEARGIVSGSIGLALPFGRIRHGYGACGSIQEVGLGSRCIAFSVTTKPGMSVGAQPTLFQTPKASLATSAATAAAVAKTHTKAKRRRAATGDLGFADMKIAPQVLGALSSLRMTHPSSIQRLAIPVLLRKWDPVAKKVYIPPTVAIQDYTGSGKTYAYGIPILSNIDNYIDERILPAAVAQVLNDLEGVALPPPAEQDLELLRAGSSRSLIHYADDLAFNSNVNPEDDTGRPAGELAQPGPMSEREKRIAALRAKLMELFPDLPPSATDPEAPASRLQAIIVVPTKELAVQVGRALEQINLPGQKLRKHHPVVIRVLAGSKITPNILADLGIQLNRPAGEHAAPGGYDDPEEVEDTSSPHPFVEFGRGHKHYSKLRSENETVKANVREELEEKILEQEFRETLPEIPGSRTLRAVRVLTPRRLQQLRLQGEVDKHGNMVLMDMKLGSSTNQQVEATKMLPSRDTLENHDYSSEKEHIVDGTVLADPESREGMSSNSKEGDVVDIFEVVRSKRLRALQKETKSPLATSETKPKRPPEAKSSEHPSLTLDGAKTPLEWAREAATTRPDPFRREKYDADELPEQVRLIPLEEDTSRLRELLGWSGAGEIEIDRSKQPHIVVGTPELLVTLIQHGALQLPAVEASASQLKYLVFDEIDHLARTPTAPGHQAVKQLMTIPCDQMVFVSASMSPDVSLAMTRMAGRQGLFVEGKKFPHMTRNGSQYLPVATTVQEASITGLPAAPFVGPRQRAGETSAIATSCDVAKELLFICSEHYRTDYALEQRSKAISTESKEADVIHETVFTGTETSGDIPVEGEENTRDDERSEQTHTGAGVKPLPLPPYLKHYYIRVPRKISKTAFLLDLLARMKLVPKAEMEMIALRQRRESREKSVWHTAQQAEDTISTDSHLHDSAIVKSLFEGSLSNNPKLLAELRAEFVKSQQNSASETNASSETITLQGVNASAETQDDGKDEEVGMRPSPSSVVPVGGQGAALCFFNTSTGIADFGLQRQIAECGLRVGTYHERSPRQVKSKVLGKSEELDVILTTDVLARGIDMKHLSVVVNVDVPRSSTVYYHRAGRVARMGAKYRKNSIVLTLVQEDDGFENSESTELIQLRKHADRLGIPIREWNEKVIVGCHKKFANEANIAIAATYRGPQMKIRKSSEFASTKKTSHKPKKSSSAKASSSPHQSRSDKSNWITWNE